MRIALALAAAASAVTVAAQQPTFRAGVDTVEIYATVKHSNGRLVPNLPREAFEVRSDGKPVEITVFSNQPKTITVALMLDVSGSMTSSFLWTRDAAGHFVDALTAGDRARIGSFGMEVSVSPHLTGDRTLLKRLLRDELWPGGGTPIWQAIHAAMSSLAAEKGRRVVLVVSDGNPEVLRVGVLEPRLKAKAIDEQFMVYALSVANRGLSTSLEGLSDASGGGFVKLRGDEDLGAAMAAIADELRHQYLIGFSPPVHDGRTHRLEVRLKGGGMTARTAERYRAPSK